MVIMADKSINLSELDTYIDLVISKINAGVAAARARGILAEMPTEVQFSCTVQDDRKKSSGQNAREDNATDEKKDTRKDDDKSTVKATNDDTSTDTGSGTRSGNQNDITNNWENID
jgi:hypothetical protein